MPVISRENQGVLRGAPPAPALVCSSITRGGRREGIEVMPTWADRAEALSSHSPRGLGGPGPETPMWIPATVCKVHPPTQRLSTLPGPSIGQSSPILTHPSLDSDHTQKPRCQKGGQVISLPAAQSVTCPLLFPGVAIGRTWQAVESGWTQETRARLGLAWPT